MSFDYDLKTLIKDCELNKNFLKLYKKFSPGPITFVLNLKKKTKSNIDESGAEEEEANKQYEEICSKLWCILKHPKLSDEAKHKAILKLTGWK